MECETRDNAFLTRAEYVPGFVVTKFDRPTCIGSFPVRLGRLTIGSKEARSPNWHWLSHLGVYHGSIDMSISWGKKMVGAIVYDHPRFGQRSGCSEPPDGLAFSIGGGAGSRTLVPDMSLAGFRPGQTTSPPVGPRLQSTVVVYTNLHWRYGSPPGGPKNCIPQL